MSQKYTVTIEAWIPGYIQLEVEAEHPQNAIDKALEEAEHNTSLDEFDTECPFVGYETLFIKDPIPLAVHDGTSYVYTSSQIVDTLRNLEADLDNDDDEEVDNDHK
jgi:hypothetical protein